MPNITSTNVAQAIVKLVASRALPALVGNLVMGNLVNRDFETELKSQGDVVSVTIPGSAKANNIGETGSVQTQNQNLGNAQIVLNTHIESSFAIPDVTKVIAHPDLLSMYMQPAVNAVAEKIESDLMGTWPLFTSNLAVGADNTALTESVVDEAEKSLFDAKVPQTDRKYLVVTSKAHSEIRQISRFSENQTNGNGSAIVTGQVGTLKDFSVIRSQYVKSVGGAGRNLAFHRDAIALVMRRLPIPLPGTGAVAEYAELGNFGIRVVMSYQPNTLGQQFTVDALYGVGALRNSFATLVKN